jgi:tRNA dimethylallyltransferase
MKEFVALLMGPTGSGKSDVAVAIAERLPFEIISVDSALIYRQMDIGTAKPSLEVRGRVPHHLIDICDPRESYSAGAFLRDAARLMQQIRQRGRHPLLAGGTMLYFHALTEGISRLPGADRAIRQAIDTEAEKRGWESLHAELARIDPAAAGRIHVNDPQRIQRALEVFRMTGRPISELQRTREPLLEGTEVAEIILAPTERADLHVRIEERLARMMQRGFLEEVRKLHARGDLSLNLPSMRSVGYRQLWQHVDQRITLDEAVKSAVVATRQLAKRQWTWLRRRSSAAWFDALHSNVAGDVTFALSKRIAAWSASSRG